MRPGHFGLIGMQERASAIGAELSLNSPLGGGTVVHLFLRARLSYISSSRDA